MTSSFDDDLWFDYPLPSELIAQTPVEPRDSSRLLVIHRDSGRLLDRRFHDLPELLSPGDLLVVNDTRVFPARIRARKSTGARIEILFLQHIDRAENRWQALARPARKLNPGDILDVLDQKGSRSGHTIGVEGRLQDQVMVRLLDGDETLSRFGEVPLPPYVTSKVEDDERYQTVYSKSPGSAAAPTAGLHFTPELMRRCGEQGISFTTVTLHIGLDTFQPIKTDNPLDHQIHSEWFQVNLFAQEAIRETRENGGRVVAIGTTAVRTLESAASVIAECRPNSSSDSLSGWTNLFITPGYDFQLVQAMVTNFHLPRTTLLLLVSAFAGTDLTQCAYAHAIEQRYRFYSFGDAMLIL
jgi:S-adenosylmethionine:tRNA ribosyltransferase-isomerase